LMVQGKGRMESAPMKKLYWIETWGCQMNEHDSEKMAGILEGLGYRPAAAVEEADLAMLNTCAIREKAEEKVYQALARLKAAKKAHPEMIVGVAGCVSQMAGQDVRRRVPHVDLVVGPRAVSRLPDLLARVQSERGVIDTTLYPDSLVRSVADPVRKMKDKGKAWVTVMEGCNKTCAYCIVPTTRGREESRTIDSLLSEVRQLAKDGYFEIEFLGQNVNAYRCPETGAGLADLLRATARIEGIIRIRFATSHPLHLREPIIEAMAETPEVCEFLHLPVQSGSSSILAAMRRGYTREKYLERVEQLRSALPEISLGTDVIVGFPGEGEDDFEETLSLVREVGFDQMFSFVYSPRPGTMAAMMRDEVSHEQKVARLMRLQAMQKEIQLARNEALVGRRMAVVVEGRSRRDAGEWAGRTRCNRVINFEDESASAGQRKMVLVTDARPNSLRGRALASARQ